MAQPPRIYVPEPQTTALRRIPECVVGERLGLMPGESRAVWPQDWGGLGVGHLSRPLEGHGQVDDIEWRGWGTGEAQLWLQHTGSHPQAPGSWWTGANPGKLMPGL